MTRLHPECIEWPHSTTQNRGTSVSSCFLGILNPHGLHLTGVITSTSVSKPQLKSNQVKDQKDVDARTKKPKVVPIGDSKPKRKANKSVATTHKKTVALDTTIQKPKSYLNSLYEEYKSNMEMVDTKEMSIRIQMDTNDTS
ncbi:hypothetical protein Tco_0116572 [Tanacetum coccineum]